MKRALLGLAVAAAAAFPALAPAGTSVPSVAIEGTAFRLTLADGRVLAGAGLVGHRLTIADGEGRTLSLRIDAVTPDPKDPEITLHAISVADPAAPGGWRDLCDPDPFGQRWAFPLAKPGGGIALTCTSGALGKCVRFGYKPWHPAAGGVAMRDLFEACVHMVRADYCGDGVPHTRNGTKIDVYDRAGIQRDEPAPGLRFEAAWGPGGAVCLARTRLPALATLDQVLDRCPRLRIAANGTACTDSVPGAILFNKSF
jgi:hypothetical protein